MNREIKFRAWVESQKYMAYQGTHDLETIQSFMHHFGDELLMQFTGFNDKNGKEIYEGDVVIFKLSHDDKSIEIVSKVESLRYAWRLKGLWLLTEIYDVEIIGNIYENPELLKN